MVDSTPILLTHLDRATKNDQVIFYNEKVDEEWEVERPSGAPTLYRWLMAEKIRLALEGLDPTEDTAIVACCGSGMDAELLARRGFSVVATDISLGATNRTRARADRHQVNIDVVVADVQQLPFEDSTFDIAFVHDGLHHLERPHAGIAEMARVARHAVCISEPAAARATRLAVKLGLALDVEEAGNRVVRFDPLAVAAFLESKGFRTLRARRYAMYYKHVPGRAVRLLSHEPLLSLSTSAFRAANAIAGRWGNKMVVVGVREGDARAARSTRVDGSMG